MGKAPAKKREAELGRVASIVLFHPRWHSVTSGITRPILLLRKAFDVLILLLVFAVPASYLP